MRYDNGKDDLITFDVTSGGARAVELFREGGDDKLEFPGRITSLVVDALGVTKRGEYYAHTFLERSDVDKLLSLGAFYVTSEFFGGLGVFENNLGGRGRLLWRPVAEDIAPADITEALAATNALRRVYGVVWYYHASGDVADRTMVINLRTPGPALPTGITTGGTTTIHTFPYAGAMTLSANQEGMIYILDNFAVSADNASRTFENTSIKQTGFPMWIREDSLEELLFNVTDEEAADRHSIYVLQEEWLTE